MKKQHKNFVIYFTSDHAEMLGFLDEKERYVHSQLVFGDTYGHLSTTATDFIKI